MSTTTRRAVGESVLYSDHPGSSTARGRKDEPARITDVFTEDDGQGYMTGYRVRFDRNAVTIFAFPDELRTPATDWKAIAEQHARQRDEAMRQRDTLQEQFDTAITQRNESRDSAIAHRDRLLADWEHVVKARDDYRKERDEARTELANLRETVSVHRAVRELVKTENARRRFANDRRTEMFPGRRAMPLIDL
jgi:hypothetical protein